MQGEDTKRVHPYQHPDLEKDADDGALCASSQGPISSDLEDDPFEKPQDEILAAHYRLPSGNQYRNIDNQEFDALLPDKRVKKLSKTEFVRTATRVLKQYSPTTGRRRVLRTEFREFLQSSEGKSPSIRQKIIERLLRFDITKQGYAPLVFNREIEASLLRELKNLSGLGDDQEI